MREMDVILRNKDLSTPKGQISLRILLSIAAIAYEEFDDSIVSDSRFDNLCLMVDPQISTGDKVLDKFFSEDFCPSTGSWIHRHPNKEGIRHLYKAFYENKRKYWGDPLQTSKG